MFRTSTCEYSWTLNWSRKCPTHLGDEHEVGVGVHAFSEAAGVVIYIYIIISFCWGKGDGNVIVLGFLYLWRDTPTTANLIEENYLIGMASIFRGWVHDQDGATWWREGSHWFTCGPITAVVKAGLGHSRWKSVFGKESKRENTG